MNLRSFYISVRKSFLYRLRYCKPVEELCFVTECKKKKKKNEAEFTPQVFPSESPSNNPFRDTQYSTKMKKFANAYDIDYK